MKRLAQVTIRNKGGEARVVQEGAKGTKVELSPAGSHGAKVGDDGVIIVAGSGGSVEIEAGQVGLIVGVLDDEGTPLSETPIAAGATVTCTGTHALLVSLDQAAVAEIEEAEAKDAEVSTTVTAKK